MDKLCFSIDEERYDDRHGHVLSLVGWYMHTDKKKCSFQLIGDGYEVLDIPEGKYFFIYTEKCHLPCVSEYRCNLL